MHSENFLSDHMNRIPLAVFLVEDDGGRFLECDWSYFTVKFLDRIWFSFISLDLKLFKPQEETPAPTPTIPSSKGKII